MKLGFFRPSRLRISAAIILIVAAAGCTQTSVKDNILEFTGPDLEGNTVSLSDDRFKGKVVLVDVWGSWCPPCQLQIPFLIDLQDKYGDQGLEVVGIDFEMLLSESKDEQREVMKKFVEKAGINYTMLLGGMVTEVEFALPSIKNFAGFPTTVFIGRDGLVKEVRVGFFDREASELEETVLKLLEEPSKAGGAETP